MFKKLLSAFHKKSVKDEDIDLISPHAKELLKESERDLDYSFSNMERELKETTRMLKLKIQQLDMRIKAVTSNVEEMIIVKTQNSRWISINNIAEEFFGIDPKRCIGKTSREIVKIYPHLREFTDQLEKIEGDVLSTGEAKEIRCVLHIENKPLLIDLVVTATDTANRIERELVIVGNDVRHKYDSVKHLLVDENLLNLSPEPCAAVDQFDRIFVANVAYKKLFGIPATKDLLRDLPPLFTKNASTLLERYDIQRIPVYEKGGDEPFYHIISLHLKEDAP